MNLKQSITNKSKELELIFTIAALLVMLIQLALFLQRGYSLITFPYDLTSGEGLLVRDASNIRNGLPVYSNPNEFPYIISIYPPIYAIIVAFVSTAIGIGLGTARLVAVASSLLVCILIALIVHRATDKWLLAIVSGLSYVSSLFVFQWSAFARVDTLSVFWSVLAIYIVYRRVTLWNVCLAALFCVLAFYTKQTALAAAISIAFYLVFMNRRFAFWFIVMVGVSIIGIMFLLNGATHGQFYLQTIAYNVQGYFIRALFSFLRALSILHAIALVLAALYVWFAWKGKNLKQLPIFFCASAGMMIWTVGRAGSTINHFLEFIAAVTILAGLFWGRLEANRNAFSFLIPALLSVQVIWSLSFPFSPLGQFYRPDDAFTRLPTDQERSSCKVLDHYVRNSVGPILSEEVGVLMENKKDAVGSAWMINVLHERGVVDKAVTTLRNKILAKEFSLILLHGESYPSEILADVKENYHLTASVNCYFQWRIFVPE